MTVRVFDVLGREVAALADGLRVAETLSLPVPTGDLPSGLYLVRIETGGAVATRPLAVTR